MFYCIFFYLIRIRFRFSFNCVYYDYYNPVIYAINLFDFEIILIKFVTQRYYEDKIIEN